MTPTQDEGQLVSALHKVKQSGEADLATAINVASLALKHRQNKNQRQRIIAFVGSPVSANDQQLVRVSVSSSRVFPVPFADFGHAAGQEDEEEQRLNRPRRLWRA